MKLYLKIFFLWILISIIIILNLKFKKPKSTNCINDTVLDILYIFRIYIIENITLRFILLTINSITLDLYCGFYLFYKILYKGKYLHFGAGILIFYILRNFIQKLFIFPIPELFNFYNTFPSILIKYGRMNDLYYSGHTGITLYFLLIAFFKEKLIFYKILSLFMHITTIVTLLLTSVHYTNDIWIGYIVTIILFYYNYICYYKLKYISINLLFKIMRKNRNYNSIGQI